MSNSPQNPQDPPQPQQFVAMAPEVLDGLGMQIQAAQAQLTALARAYQLALRGSTLATQSPPEEAPPRPAPPAGRPGDPDAPTNG
jgi:hypothetical protein